MLTSTSSFLLLIAFASGFGSTISIESGSDEPSVVTECGTLKGKTVHTSKGQCHAYLGVPFAAPPVGDLRFTKPQPPQCWTGVRNATELGPACIQLGSTGRNPPEIESEDCLYLNVLVPSSSIDNPNSKLPVMVFIHGGGFVTGSAGEYGVEGPCENLANRGVIVVLIQYRLNHYGFFSTGDEVAPGNFVIWDQIEALKWVQKNIDRFGGDSGKVTIFGESAGGASVSYLTYMPVAKDLFHRSISQSGSARAFWASPREVSVSSSEKILRATNCTEDSSEAAVRCVRRASTADIQTAANAVLNMTFWEFYEYWSIRVDGELFAELEFRELDDGKAAVIGVNSMEEPVPLVENIPTAVELFERSLKSTFDGGNDTAKNEAIKAMARYVYLESKGDPSDRSFVAQQLAKFLEHRMFHTPAALEASTKAAVGKPVWVYNFDYWNEEMFADDYPFEKGTKHAHELCYLFLMTPPPEQQEYFHCPTKYRGTFGLVADYLGEMWTNFAKNGDPSPEVMRWPQFKNVSRASTMLVRSELSIDPHFYLDVASFWNSLVPKMNQS